jgi:ammonium transporter, Amt family
LIEVVSIIVFAFGLSYVFFSALKRAGVLRSRAEDEIAGLDIPEMGEQGYVAGELSVPGGEVTAPTVVTGVTAPAS